MEQRIKFNGVKILLTTGRSQHEIQNFVDEEFDLILSVYPGDIRVLEVRDGLL